MLAVVSIHSRPVLVGAEVPAWKTLPDRLSKLWPWFAGAAPTSCAVWLWPDAAAPTSCAVSVISPDRGLLLIFLVTGTAPSFSAVMPWGLFAS